MKLETRIKDFEENYNPQTTKQWQIDRIGYLTSSQFNKYFYKRKGFPLNFGNILKVLQAEKVMKNFIKNDWDLQNIIDQFYSKAQIKQFEWGHAFEGDAKQLLIDKGYFKEIKQVGFIKSDKFDMLGGSPDGIGDGHTQIEIKCPYSIGTLYNIKQFGLFKDTSPEYYWQVVCNMYITGLTKGLFISYDPRLIDETNPNQSIDEYTFIQEFTILDEDIIFIEDIMRQVNEYKSKF